MKGNWGEPQNQLWDRTSGKYFPRKLLSRKKRGKTSGFIGVCDIDLLTTPLLIYRKKLGYTRITPKALDKYIGDTIYLRENFGTQKARIIRGQLEEDSGIYKIINADDPVFCNKVPSIIEIKHGDNIYTSPDMKSYFFIDKSD